MKIQTSALALFLFCAIAGYADSSWGSWAPEPGIGRAGNDYRSYETGSGDWKACKQTCETEGQCKAWTLYTPQPDGPSYCWLKQAEGVAQAEAQSISGVRETTAPDDGGAEFVRGEQAMKQANDMAEAIRQWEAAAAKNNAAAMRVLGWVYDTGQGVAADGPKAVSWYRKAGERGDSHALYNLGRLYLQGKGIPVDVPKGLEALRQAAALGHLDATFELADKLHADNKTDEAIVYWRQAAEKNHAASQRILGWLYDNGIGLPRDHVQAIAWFRKAGEHGDSHAYFLLGGIYAHGRNVPVDLPQGREYLRRAESMGHPDAKAEIAKLPAEKTQLAAQPIGADNGIAEYRKANQFYRDKNLTEGFNWMRLAADKGYPNAQRELAFAHIQGNGTTTDVATGVRLLEQLAASGNSASVTAMINLSNLYRSGHYLPQDMARSSQWLQKAASTGDSMAITLAQRRGVVEMQKNPQEQAFIARIDREGPSMASLADFHYDVGVYCQYQGPRCGYWQGQYQQMERNWNNRAAALNQQRLWNVYSSQPGSSTGMAAEPCTAASGCLGQQQQRHEWEKQLDKQLERK
jgi:TPR repeat protein